MDAGGAVHASPWSKEALQDMLALLRTVKEPHVLCSRSADDSQTTVQEAFGGDGKLLGDMTVHALQVGGLSSAQHCMLPAAGERSPQATVKNPDTQPEARCSPAAMSCIAPTPLAIVMLSGAPLAAA